jgi:hypothetical protein
MNVPQHLWMPTLLRSLGVLTSSFQSTRSSPYPYGTRVCPVTTGMDPTAIMTVSESVPSTGMAEPATAVASAPP